MFSKQVLAFAMALATAEAAYQGFNYGSTKVDGSSKYEADFKTEFQTAKNLVGTSGFTSARLYTMIQGGTSQDPIQAIPAAIAEDTSLLLGLWASGGNMANELAALKAAISTYGDDFGKNVVGISVGSEDMYRNSVTGSKSNAGPGLEPDVLVDYVKQVRSAIAGTSLSGASIGHVDTWDSWTNSSNAAVIDALDWLGFDGYPYYQLTMANGIDNAKALFDDSVDKIKGVAKGKEVWITETGWPVSGPQEGDAVASIANAKQYWDQVACPLLGNTNTWWYMLDDAGASPSFGLTSGPSNTTPLFDLSCKSSNSTSSSSSSAAASSATAGPISDASGSNSKSSGSSSGASGSNSGASGSSSGASGSISSSPSGSSTGTVTGSSSGSAPSSTSSGVSSSSKSPSGGFLSPVNGTRTSGFGSTSVVSATPLSSASNAAGSPSSGASSAVIPSGARFGSNSGSGTSSAPSASSTQFNSANRASGSAFGALVVAVVLGVAV